MEAAARAVQRAQAAEPAWLAAARATLAAAEADTAGLAPADTLRR
jgi:hypothetical protein